MESRIGLVLILSLFTAACGARVIHVLESVPAEYQLKLAKLPRVSGRRVCHTGKKPEFDLNLETVRLIRTPTAHLVVRTGDQAEPLTIDTEQRLSDVAYWRRLGEEYGRPLIVTGTVRLLLGASASRATGNPHHLPAAGGAHPRGDGCDHRWRLRAGSLDAQASQPDAVRRRTVLVRVVALFSR
mgnify:CR=1 FL=1